MKRRDSGFAMLLVFAMAGVVAIMLYMQMPRVAFEAQRAKEGLLIERGEQYQRAIQLFVRKNGRYPATLDELEKLDNRRYLRRRYADPMTGKAEWRLIHIGPGGVFTDSLVHKQELQGDKEKSVNTFVSELGGVGQTAAGTTAQSAVPQRRASEGGMPGMGGGMAPGQIYQQPGQPYQTDMTQQMQSQPDQQYPQVVPGLPPGVGVPQPGQAALPGQSPIPGQTGFPGVGQPYQPYSPQNVDQPYSAPGEQPGLQPGQPVTMQPGSPAVQSYQLQPGQPGYPGVQQYPVQPGQPTYPGAQPSPLQPGQPGYPVAQPVPAQPGYPGAQQYQPGQPGYPGAQQYQPGQPGYPIVQPYQTQPGQVVYPGAQQYPGQPAYPGAQPYPVQPAQQNYPGAQPYPIPAGQTYPQASRPAYPAQPGMGSVPGTQQYPTAQYPPAQFPGSVPTQQSGRTVVPTAGQNDATRLIQGLLTRPRPGGSPVTGGLGMNIQGGIAGVASTLERSGIKLYNDRDKYNEWEFLYDLTKDQSRGGIPGGQGMAGQMTGQSQQPGQGFPPPFGAQPQGPGGFGSQPGPGQNQQPGFGQPAPFPQPPSTRSR